DGAGADDDDGRAHGEARAARAVGADHVAGDAGGALSRAIDLLDAAVGVDARAEGEGARDVRDQRGALGAGRASEHAGFGARAVHLVAHVLDDLPALGLGSGAEERVVAAEGLGILVRGRDALLDAGEGALHVAGADALDAVLARPAVEDLFGRAPR